MQNKAVLSLSMLLFMMASESLIAQQPKIQLFVSPEEAKSAVELGLKPLQFMPGLYIGRLSTQLLSNSPLQKKSSLVPSSHEELEISTASILLKTPENSTKAINN